MKVRDNSDKFNWLINRMEDYLHFLRSNVPDENDKDKEEWCERFERALRFLGDYKLDEDLKRYNQIKEFSKLSKNYKPTAQEVKKLRELTGAGMAECKRTLERLGNMEEAIEYLKTRPIKIVN